MTYYPRAQPVGLQSYRGPQVAYSSEPDGTCLSIASKPDRSDLEFCSLCNLSTLVGVAEHSPGLRIDRMKPTAGWAEHFAVGGADYLLG